MEFAIDAVHLHHCRIGIHAKYATATLTEANSLIVELCSGDLTGWGEVFMPNPAPLWEWALRVAPLLIGQDAGQLDALIEQWPADRPKLAKADCGTYCHPDVDCVAEAVSIALHDMLSQARGCPFAALLGDIQRREIPGMPTITIDAAETMATAAEAWASRGARFLKLKLSGVPDDDIAIINAVDERLAGAINIQVDANGAYQTMAQAEAVMARLDAAGVAVVEDLFDIGNIDFCRAAKTRLDAKYMIDKDAHWPHVQTVLKLGAADIINQHPHNQGRMSYAMRIAEAAQAAGVENAIGASGIFGIQNTAFLHLSAVTGLTRPCEDIGMHNYFQGPPNAGPGFAQLPTVLADPIPLVAGTLQLPTAPGLGVIVDRERLSAMSHRTASFS